MSPLEAKIIIDALANGIEPETGEILPAHHVFNNPNIIRALFAASGSLEKTAKLAKRERALPSNAGRPWPASEDKELLDSFDSGATVKEIATKHGRTQGAIASRLVRLGRIGDRSEVYNRA